MRCNRNNRYANTGANCAQTADCGCDRQEFSCSDDRQVFKHQHVVTHKHDVIHEYDVVHRHEYHYYDVVNVSEESETFDHRNHRHDYCQENGDCTDNGGGSGEIEVVSGRNCCCD